MAQRNDNRKTHYNLNITQGGSYTITPSKSNDIVVLNGISTADILLIRRHILGTPLGSPYRIIAADVNGSNSVTTLDLLLIRSLILGNNPTFPNQMLWTFVPSSYIFANPLNPLTYITNLTYSAITQLSDQDFIGIKLGDVNNSWDSNILKTDAAGAVRFEMEDRNVHYGEELIVPVKVKDFINITGYQFTISWNHEVLELLDVKNKSLNGFYGMMKTSEGILTTSWDDDMATAVSLNNNETVFELKFKVIGKSGSSSEIKLGSELTPSEAYNENLDLLNILSHNGMVKVGDGSSIAKYQTSIINLLIQPNPFTNATNIIFIIPQDETVIIVIYDLLGKEIKHLKADYKAGQHKIEWACDNDAGQSLSKGLYYVRMIAGDITLSSKVVIMK